MPVDVKFAYVCRFQFTDLPGDGNDVRHCNQCRLNVTNLDAMNDDAAAKFLQDASENRKSICVSATARLPDVKQCRGPAPLMRTLGTAVPEPKILLDVVAPENMTAAQYGVLMNLLELPNRLAVARVVRKSPTIRLGVYWEWKLRERIIDPLDKVGLKWTTTKISYGEDAYWKLEAESAR